MFFLRTFLDAGKGTHGERTKKAGRDFRETCHEQTLSWPFRDFAVKQVLLWQTELVQVVAQGAASKVRGRFCTPLVVAFSQLYVVLVLVNYAVLAMNMPPVFP